MGLTTGIVIKNFDQPRLALAMKNTTGHIKRIITGVRTGVKVMVTVKVIMIKQKLETPAI